MVQVSKFLAAAFMLCGTILANPDSQAPPPTPVAKPDRTTITSCSTYPTTVTADERPRTEVETVTSVILYLYPITTYSTSTSTTTYLTTTTRTRTRTEVETATACVAYVSGRKVQERWEDFMP